MEALLHVPGNDAKQQTFRIRVSDDLSPETSNTCTACVAQPSESTAKNQPQAQPSAST